jgi:hypothetical protein
MREALPARKTKRKLKKILKFIAVILKDYKTRFGTPLCGVLKSSLNS